MIKIQEKVGGTSLNTGFVAHFVLPNPPSATSFIRQPLYAIAIAKSIVHKLVGENIDNH